MTECILAFSPVVLILFLDPAGSEMVASVLQAMKRNRFW